MEHLKYLKTQEEIALKDILKILESHYPEVTIPLAIEYIRFRLDLPMGNERNLLKALEILGGNDGNS